MEVITCRLSATFCISPLRPLVKDASCCGGKTHTGYGCGYYSSNKRGNMRITEHWGAFAKKLWPCKSNKFYYFFVCVHAWVRACVRVCLRVWLPGRVGECMCVRACVVAYQECNVHAPYCILICGLSGSVRGFDIISYTAGFSKKKNIEHKMRVFISSITLWKTFFILRKIQRDIVINVKKSSCKVPVSVVRF
jgi:hypothetical protein